MRGVAVRAALGWMLALAPAAVAVADPAPWIAVVQSPATVEALDDRSLALVFRRKQLFAAEGGRWLPVNLPADHALRRRFSRVVLGASPEALEDYWNQQYFQGVLPPHVLGSEQAVLRFVASTPNAVGYVGACHEDADVRTVLLIDPEGAFRAPGEAPACAAR